MKLFLAVKAEYFDAIQSGEKVVEYRLVNDYWKKRLVGRDYDEIVITKGYPKRDDESRRMYFDWHGCMVKTITHPHFGDAPVEVYAIPLAEKVTRLDMELYRAGLL